jgi:hypothetical protein
VYICGSKKGSKTYVGMSKKDGKSIRLPVKVDKDGNYIATNGKTTYTLHKTGSLTVVDKGVAIVNENGRIKPGPNAGGDASLGTSSSGGTSTGSNSTSGASTSSGSGSSGGTSTGSSSTGGTSTGSDSTSGASTDTGSGSSGGTSTGSH